MKTASIYGAFNARWLDPEDVARSFVPTLPFKSLVHLQNSLLMGPRGCGKTTLLKMLTRRAQRVWQKERFPKDPRWVDYRSPDFEAVYVPSDIRWSAELESLSKELAAFPIDAQRAQRASVAVSAVQEATRVFEAIVEEGNGDPIDIVKALISHLELGQTVPSFRDVRLKLGRWIDEIQARLIRRDVDAIRRHLDVLPAAFTSHALTAVTNACTVFAEYAGELAPSRWALCFDELEIAPTWLQAELFAALRSFDQRFLLKLTWSPVLPSDLMPRQERQHDYAAIRMWHGHALDAKPFCKEFSARILDDRLSSSEITPNDVFGPSPFAQDDEETYDRGAQIWHVMVDLARRDSTFNDYLLQHGFSPDDPVTERISLRDESLRKIKPIVLLRDAYLKDFRDRGTRRSRKNPLLYYGEDAIYAMSEGNPRLLAGLLNELIDVGIRNQSSASSGSSYPLVRPEVQSRILHSASLRTLTGIRTYPIRRESRRQPLKSLIDKLGTYLHSELVTNEFKADPVGSFFVDQDVSPDVLNEISIGLLIGALVPVRSLQADDIPSSIRGSRIRLSYMLAPSYKLLFRNYREMRLSTALRISASSQRLMFRPDGE